MANEKTPPEILFAYAPGAGGMAMYVNGGLKLEGFRIRAEDALGILGIAFASLECNGSWFEEWQELHDHFPKNADSLNGINHS